MNIYPVLLDCRPPYAGNAAAPASLLLLPLGVGSVLSHARSRLAAVTPHAPAVFASIEDADGYRTAIRRMDPSVECIVGPAEFRARLEAYEMSDCLLVMDPGCMPITGMTPESLLRHPLADSRWARHLVALDRSVDGTRECVEFDASGNVRRIQRFYETVTWPFTDGVSCSLIPAACALLGEELPWRSLTEIRRNLVSRGIPGRDFPVERPVLHLDVEDEMLALSERFVTDAVAVARRTSASSTLYVGQGHRVDRSARLIGPVILQDGVVVEEQATIVGPTVIGAGARVGRGALVAQSLVAAGAVIASGATARQRVLFGDTGAGADSQPAPAFVYSLRTATLSEPGPRGSESAREALYPSLKPVVEAALAVVALVVLAPLLLLIAALIKLDSRGSALYGHRREGKDGRLFRCWKFRTMLDGAQAHERALYARNQVDGPQFKLNEDPRITRMGRWLRPSSVDELPQLLNVALGQMSLVGPRPSPFRENQVCVPWREGRLSVRPGITGLWQVCRHDRAAGDFHQWIWYDLLYVRCMSLATDVKILIATVLTGGGKGRVRLSWIVPASVLDEQP